jgi:ABC-2 type transport system permease protein
MNAPAVNAAAVNHVAAHNPMNKLRWLLTREYWEHKGGFLWAPVITAAVFLCLVVGVFVIFQLSVDRSHIEIANLELDLLLQKMTPEIAGHVRDGVEGALYLVGGLFGVVLFFVTFFYCLGALYDDRRDRSVLFWKSLPVSDSATVLSKVITALLVAPLISTVLAILTGIAFLALVTVFGAFHGVNVLGLLWGDLAPARVGAHLFALIPVQMLWSLPTIGWLLLCSSWAKSKPFLWALALPIGSGVLVSMADLMQSLAAPDSWFWENVVARVLLSIFPGSWLDATQIDDRFEGPGDLLRLVDLGSAYQVLGTLELWVGAVAGIAMIVAAVYFRRKRDEG